MKKILIALLFLTGCSTNYYKSVDGVNFGLGVSLPNEEYLQIQAVNYLSGQKTTVKNTAQIFQVSEFVSSNDYFGVIHIRENRINSVYVVPVLTNNLEKAEAYK